MNARGRTQFAPTMIVLSFVGVIHERPAVNLAGNDAVPVRRLIVEIQLFFREHQGAPLPCFIKIYGSRFADDYENSSVLP